MSGPLALLLSVLVVGFFFHHLVVHAHFVHVWACLLFVHARTSVLLSTSHKLPIRLRPQELCLLLIFIRFLSYFVVVVLFVLFLPSSSSSSSSASPFPTQSFSLLAFHVHLFFLHFFFFNI